MTNQPFMYSRYPEDTLETVGKYLQDSSADWVTEFESRFLEYMPGDYAIAVNSATSGLHAALVALGVTAGDEVITPGLTVIMDAVVCRHIGAVPIFADVCLDSHNITAESIRERITEKTKAIIIVDWQGLPCNYAAIKRLSNEFNIPVICDSAQTILSSVNDEKCGDQFEFHIYSFEQKKHLTTGSEGGMIVTNDENLAEKARKFAGIGYRHLMADAGRTSLSKSVAQDPDYKRFDRLGLNYRMCGLSAAVGLAQLARLPEAVQHRCEVANVFKSKITNLGGFKFQQPTSYSATHSYYTLAVVKEEDLDWKSIYRRFTSCGGAAFYAAVCNPYLEQPFLGKSFSWQNLSTGLCKNAELLQRNVISFKTNYLTVEDAVRDADLFCETITELRSGS